MALENHRSFPATSKNPCSILRASSTRYAGAIRTWHSTPTLPHSITPRGRIRGRDEDSLPDEACGPIITPAEKSASQARRAPQIGERSWENEALVGHSAPSNCSPLLRVASKPAAVFGLAVILFELSLHIANAQKLRIGISMKTLDAPYFAAQGKAAEEEVKKLGGTTISADAQNDMMKQIADVEDMLAKLESNQ